MLIVKSASQSYFLLINSLFGETNKGTKQKSIGLICIILAFLKQQKSKDAVYYITACVVMVSFLDLQVEKNEEADQKIEQDGTTNKPEDKAHKAATKIQASFRGHITRKKMKDGEKEKDGDSPAAAEEATEGGEEVQKAEGEPKMNGEVAPEEGEAKKEEETSQDKSPVAEKPANSPAAAATSPAAPPTTEPQKQESKPEEKTEEKPKEADAKSPTTATAEEKKEEKEKSEEKQEEARQADVPAAVSQTAEEEEPNQTKDQAGTLTPGTAAQNLSFRIALKINPKQTIL